MSIQLRIFYFVVLVGEILCGEMNLVWGVYILKPLLLLSLILATLRQTSTYKNVFLLALLGSFLGDICLMWNQQLMFLLGLSCFLSTHLLYSWIFSKKASYRPSILVFFILGVGFFYLTVLHKKLPNELLVPVIVYMLVITFMGITLNSLNVTKKYAGFWVGFGAILFIISDSLIAVNEFTTPIPHPTLLIMSTYGVAQYLIVTRYLKIFKENNP